MNRPHRTSDCEGQPARPSIGFHITSITSASGLALVCGTPAVGQFQFDWPEFIIEDEWVSSVATGDFDNDGWVDVAADRGENVSIYRNLQGSGFELLGEIQSPRGYGGNDIVARDFDRDGHLDIAYAGSADDVVVAFNDGDGVQWDVFAIEVLEDHIDLHDGIIDPSGDIDLLLAHELGVSRIEFDREGNLTEETLIDHSADDFICWATTTGDIDDDGDFDILTLSVDGYSGSYSYKVEDSQIEMLINQGDGTFETSIYKLPWNDLSSFRPVDLARGDMDGDGDLDFLILVSDTGEDTLVSEFHVLENLDDSSDFTLYQEVRFGFGHTWRFTVGDFDTDGIIDVVTSADQVRGVFVFKNRGDFRFRLPVAIPNDMRYTREIAVADLNGDGHLDILCAGGDGVSYMLNTTRYEGPTIELEPMVRGEETTIRVHGAEPFEEVHLGFSFNGWGPTLGIADLGGITLDLRSKVLYQTTVTADENGNAELTRVVPAVGRTGVVTVQGAIERGVEGMDSVKTPFATTTIRRP